MRLSDHRHPIRQTVPHYGLVLVWVIVFQLACDEPGASPTNSETGSDGMTYMDGSTMGEVDPDADAVAPVDGSLVLDTGLSTDATGVRDVSHVDAGGADEDFGSGGEVCRHTCQSDDTCDPSEECVSVSRPECGANFRACVDRCENHLYRAPRDLRCCAGETARAPVCREGTWSCPEGTAQFQTFSDGCGPGTNVPEEGIYCGTGAQPSLCDPRSFCCMHVVTRCTDDQDINCYFRQYCDGPEDCTGADVCCVFRSDSPNPRYASACRAAGDCVGENELVTCNTPADCPPAQSCCAEAMTGISTAICRPNCLVGP